MKETFRGVVYPWQCDILDHMNVQFYMEKFDQAAWGFFGILGISPDYFFLEERGIVALEQKIRYYKELTSGDLVYIQSELQKIGNSSVGFRHLMYNAISNDVVAEMEVVAVQIDTRRRESCPFSAEVRALLEVGLKEKEGINEN